MLSASGPAATFTHCVVGYVDVAIDSAAQCTPDFVRHLVVLGRDGSPAKVAAAGMHVLWDSHRHKVFKTVHQTE